MPLKEIITLTSPYGDKVVDISNLKELENNKLLLKEECPSCKGTGIYVGMCEDDGAGVVCISCKGTGCLITTHKIFKERKPRNDITRVFFSYMPINKRLAPELGITDLSEFGGITYEDWTKLNNAYELPFGSESRKYLCPLEYYHNDFSKIHPKCDKVQIGHRFDTCPHYEQKTECWQELDEYIAINKTLK